MDLWYVYMRHEAQEKMNSKPTHKLLKLIFESLWMTKHKLEKKIFTYSVFKSYISYLFLFKHSKTLE